MIHRSTFLALILCTLAIAATAGAQVEGGAIAAIDEPSEAAGGGKTAPVKKYIPAKRPASSRTRSAPASRPPAPASPAKWDGFVIGDKYTFMNFEVVSAEKPYHTRAAKASGASGLVQVEILIGQDGRVLTARARTGNKLLHPEAERAALASRFNRPAVYGKPARAVGFLVYRFGPRDRE